MSSKTLSAILLALGLSACASLPPPDTGAAGSAGTLSLVTQSRTLHLASRPGFSPARYDGLAVGRIDIRRPAQLDDEDRAGYETLRAAPPSNSPRRRPRRYVGYAGRAGEERLAHGCRAVRCPAGQPRAERAFGRRAVPAAGYRRRDAGSDLHRCRRHRPARRTERLSGDVTSILSGFSRYERLKEALVDWAARCGSWDKQACATAASGS